MHQSTIHNAGLVELHTDGACKRNPGVGGWGALLCQDGVETELFGGECGTTNNRMGLMAVINGLNAIEQSRVVAITTDSQYVKNGITQWVKKWRSNGWVTSSGAPVKNQDLWRRLDMVCRRHVSVHWFWVKGHSGHYGNERADALANKGAGRV